MSAGGSAAPMLQRTQWAFGCGDSGTVDSFVVGAVSIPCVTPTTRLTTNTHK